MSNAKIDSLNDEPLWAAAASLAEYGYLLLPQLPEEEKWDMVSKMRQHSFSLTDDMSLAVGSFDPRERLHYFGGAIRHLYGLKNSLTMAKRAGYIQPDPEKMLAFEDLIEQTQQQAENARGGIQEFLKVYDKNVPAKVDAE